MFSTSSIFKTGQLLHSVHRQQTLVHLLCVTPTLIITGPPDTGLISIASYWWDIPELNTSQPCVGFKLSMIFYNQEKCQFSEDDLVQDFEIGQSLTNEKQTFESYNYLQDPHCLVWILHMQGWLVAYYTQLIVTHAVAGYCTVHTHTHTHTHKHTRTHTHTCTHIRTRTHTHTIIFFYIINYF